MEIKYLGHSSFLIKTKSSHVLIDPFDSEMVGLPYPKQKADVVIISHHHRDHDYLEAVSGPVKREDVFVIDRPGEYEVGEIEVKTLPFFHDSSKGKKRGPNLVSLMRIEDVFVLHLGDLGHTLSEKQIASLSLSDVLMVPVGGVYTIGPKQAVEIVNQLQPAVVIPMHYKQKGMSSEFDKLDTVDEFIKAGGFENVLNEEKLKLSKDGLSEEVQIVVMS